ncbi:MAG TPA: GNAT family N-acetyltransferase [Sulfolobales archaeon]|nr:GNAT family N-acetyltransferase [Sulfolobales archaeon]
MSEEEVKYTSEVFYIKFSDGSKAYLTYKVDQGKMFLVSTYTPPQHRGKGAAKKLVEKAIEVAKDRGLKVVPICSYATYYFIKNKEVRALLDEPYRNMSDEELQKYYEERLAEERAKGVQ